MVETYIHTYSYPCTFLGTFTNSTNRIYDLYHTLVMGRPMLISRYGNSAYDFIGEYSRDMKGCEEELDSSLGEAYRRSKENSLSL